MTICLFLSVTVSILLRPNIRKIVRWPVCAIMGLNEKPVRIPVRWFTKHDPCHIDKKLLMPLLVILWET